MYKSRKSNLLASTILRGGLAIAFGLPLALAVATPAVAQDYTSGSITGTVQDSAGNAIRSATVTIRSKGQGFTRSATTSVSGGFYFSGLPSGRYEITTSADGFKTETVANARVTASAATTYSVVMRSTSVAEGTAETVVVTGTRQTFAFNNTTTGATLNIPDLIKDVPVNRDLTALVLLAPGTIGGDHSFGRRSEGYLPSIGGSSVAENAYYINGLNITDFNHYTGSSLVPFDFYESVEVKTGGYPAEFGRATGGVVNAVTKSGTNEFKAAVHVNWEPDALRDTSPDTYAQRNKLDKYSTFNTVLELGGPIWKDHLFFYGLMQLNDNMTSDSGILTGVTEVDKTTSPFWGTKIDAYITDDHHLEFTYFNTRRVTQVSNYGFDPTTDKTDADPSGRRNDLTGGESWVVKYTGHITDWLTISAAYGDNRDRDEQTGATGTYYVVDNTPGGTVCGGATGAFCTSQTLSVIDIPQITKRTFYRADVDVYFNLVGDHHVRFGMDTEQNLLAHNAVRPGAAGYAIVYRQCPQARCTGTPSLADGTNFVDLNYYNTGGSFRSRNSAFYIEDEWKVLDSLTLNLGLRMDGFNNFTANGSQYVKLHQLFAPRLGFSYSPWSDDSGRFYGSFGDYYLPIAGNTAFRQGSRETYFHEYWTFTGINSDMTPILGTQLMGWPGATACPIALTPGSVAGARACAVTSNGSVQDPTSSLARNLKATQEQEFILGYEQKLDGMFDGLGDMWTVGINYTRRDLLVTAEDSAVDAAVNAYCSAHGIAGCSSLWSGFSQYTIINPGSAATIQLKYPLPGTTSDCPDATKLCTLTFSAAAIGEPKAKRAYEAIELSAKRAFDGVWSANFSYTWSKSYGNSEGYVQSDWGQDDAGITQDFDQPGLMEGAYGYLPNDRRHRIKMWGSYQVTPELMIGSQIQISSPRPLSCFGYYPDPNNYAYVYGVASHYCGGVLSPRGTAQHSDWIYNVNFSTRYNIEIPSGQLVTLRADIFNIFNLAGVEYKNEIGEITPGVVDNPYYGKAAVYQSPRSIRLGLDIAL